MTGEKYSVAVNEQAARPYFSTILVFLTQRSVGLYQDGSPDAFHGKLAKIDSTYLDGISLTYGSNPRKHIWSLATGDVSGRSLIYDCPCNVGAPDTVPYFVGHDYYCESGNPTCVTSYQFSPMFSGIERAAV